MSRNLSKKSFEMNYSLTISKFLRSRLIFQRIEFYSILIEMETTISNCINLQIHFESEKLSRLKSKLLIHPFTKSRACQTCPWQTNVRDRIFFLETRDRSTKMEVVNILAFSCTNILVESCCVYRERLLN